MLSKLCWRIIIESNALWSKLLIFRYETVKDKVMNALRGANSKNGSIWWRDLRLI